MTTKYNMYTEDEYTFNENTFNNNNLLHLLQLASPSLPVGAYSYSEGLETLVEVKTIHDRESLKHWLTAELKYGAIRLETAIVLRSYKSVITGDRQALYDWNAWLSAARETEELRNSSWQMGRSLSRLMSKIQPEVKPLIDAVGEPCNYAIAFGIAAAFWRIQLRATLLGYLQSWLTNLISVGVKLIPLGQTTGQELLLEFQPLLIEMVNAVLELEDEELSCCSVGLSLASMTHETQYTRLFRS